MFPFIQPIDIIKKKFSANPSIQKWHLLGIVQITHHSDRLVLFSNVKNTVLEQILQVFTWQL